MVKKYCESCGEYMSGECHGSPTDTGYTGCVYKTPPGEAVKCKIWNDKKIIGHCKIKREVADQLNALPNAQLFFAYAR